MACSDWLCVQLCFDWPSHQLFLQVDGPDDSVVSHSEDEEEEEAQLSVTHLPHSSVVEDRLPPIRKSIHKDVIVPAQVQRQVRFVYSCRGLTLSCDWL